MKLRSKILFLFALILFAGFVSVIPDEQTNIKNADAANCQVDTFWRWTDGRDYVTPPSSAEVGQSVIAVAKLTNCASRVGSLTVFRDNNTQLNQYPIGAANDSQAVFVFTVNFQKTGIYYFKVDLGAGLVFSSNTANVVAAPDCKISVNFDANPRNLNAANQDLTLTATVTETQNSCERVNGGVKFVSGNYATDFVNFSINGPGSQTITANAPPTRFGFSGTGNFSIKAIVEGTGYSGAFSIATGGESIQAESTPVSICVGGGGCGGGSGNNGSAGSGGGVQNTAYNFELKPPIAIPSFVELINAIGRWIFNLSIPIAVIIIIYAGIKMLISQGEPAKITEAKDILRYAIWGLVVIFIGKGFISLVKSILQLGSQ